MNLQHFFFVLVILFLRLKIYFYSIYLWFCQSVPLSNRLSFCPCLRRFPHDYLSIHDRYILIICCHISKTWYSWYKTKSNNNKKSDFNTCIYKASLKGYTITKKVRSWTNIYDTLYPSSVRCQTILILTCGSPTELT